MPKKSAGIFIINKEGKILIGHPTNHPENIWSIPKGGIDEGESVLDAALRECWEETNVDLRNKGPLIYQELEPQPYDTTKDGKPKPPNKILYTVVFRESMNQKYVDSTKFEFKCNSHVPETASWNPGVPEMDDFKWVTLNEAKDLLHYSQVRCFDSIKKYCE